MARLRINVTISVILSILSIFMMRTNAIERLSFRPDDTRNNWPKISDLKIYLESLHKIIDFCTKNKSDLDMNFVFGLFLMSVNLKSVLQLRQPQLYDERDLMHSIDSLLNKNDEILDFFKSMANRQVEAVSKDKKIASLFADEKQWIKNIQTFDRSVVVDTNYHKLKENMTWTTYLRIIDFFDMHVPSPELSDKCLASLGENPVYHDPNAKCEVDDKCYDMVINGTNFGYALTHRLLFLLLAKYGRSCSILSPAGDRSLIKDLCTKAYEEVNYIVVHDRAVLDLMTEQMTACAMGGHAQFLQRHWLSFIMRRQTSLGCYTVYEKDPSRPPMPTPERNVEGWQLSKHIGNGFKGGDGECHGHMTSIAAGILSAAIRFIFETQFQDADT